MSCDTCKSCNRFWPLPRIRRGETELAGTCKYDGARTLESWSCGYHTDKTTTRKVVKTEREET